MSAFNDHVMPRIIQRQSEINLIRNLKLPHALRVDDMGRVGRLADRALDLVREIEDLEALRGQPDHVIVTYLAAS